MGFSFVSWIVMMSIFVLSVRFFSSCIFVVSPLMFICIIVLFTHSHLCCCHFTHLGCISHIILMKVICYCNIGNLSIN